jgi:hypothetical protein
MSFQFCHCTTQQVHVPADFAYSYLREPVHVGEWAIGCLNAKQVTSDGLFEGRPLYDSDAVGYYRIIPNDQSMNVDFAIGTQELQFPQINIRVIPASVCGLVEGTCYVTLTAWKGSQRTKDSWERMIALHEAEIWIIKSKLESLHAKQGRECK